MVQRTINCVPSYRTLSVQFRHSKQTFNVFYSDNALSVKLTTKSQLDRFHRMLFVVFHVLSVECISYALYVVCL